MEKHALCNRFRYSWLLPVYFWSPANVTTVSDEDEEIILHSRKTLLFNDNEPWVKAGDSPMFEVAKGSYDGTEVCELVGFYILHKLTTAFPNGNVGLYRDDGQAAFRNTSARSLDKACTLMQSPTTLRP